MTTPTVKDLFVLTADSQLQRTIETLLNQRRLSLGIRDISLDQFISIKDFLDSGFRRNDDLGGAGWRLFRGFLEQFERRSWSAALQKLPHYSA